MTRIPLKLALLAGLGLTFAGAMYAPPAAAHTQVAVGINIGVAPPPPRFERLPPARRGYVWAPGYWRWDGYAHRHVWVGGTWVRVHPGRHYRPARWVQHGRQWRFQPGYWGR